MATIDLTDAELHVLTEAIDSLVYWQLSEPHYRDSGYVRDPGTDEPEIAEQIAFARALEAKLEALA